jgi:hypothetical protein
MERQQKSERKRFQDRRKNTLDECKNRVGAKNRVDAQNRDRKRR